MLRWFLCFLFAWLIGGPGAATAQNCSDIRPAICALKPFEPDPSTGSTDPSGSPQCDADPANLPDQKAAIQGAYDAAPPGIKGDLCAIASNSSNKLFVIESGGQHSWGRWEDPRFHTPPAGAIQIAIHADYLKPSPVKTFADIQDDHLAGLNLSAHAKHMVGTMPPRLAPQTVSVFYLLAHELGHVLWHKGAGTQEPIGCADDPNFFSWSDVQAAQNNRWTKFGDESLGDHRHRVPKPKGVTNAESLKSIYTGGFVTALASANPEEDFVETFAIRALMELCPSCEFNILIGTGANQTTIKVNDDGGNPILKAKFDCVYQNYIKPNP